MSKRSTVTPKYLWFFVTGLLPATGITQESSDGDTLEEIVVTGTLLSGENVADSQPVAVFSADDIASSGALTVQDFLLRQPFVTGQNINSSNTFFDGGNPGATTIGLRGLGARNTLVLINGRRTSQDGVSSQIDLNTIPTAAIETVQVLKSSASSLYGTDAVGGVINIILKKNIQGVTVSAYFGDTFDSDISRKELSLVSGFGNDESSFVVGAFYSDDNDANVVDRDWAAGSGFSAGSLPGAFSLPDQLFGGDGDGNSFYTPTASNPDSPADFRPFDFSVPGDRFPYQEVEPLVKPFRMFSAFANGDILLDADKDLRFVTDFSYSRTTDTFNTAPDRLFAFGTAPIPAQNYYLQQAFGADAVDIGTYFIRFVQLGPKIDIRERDIVRFYAGLEGALSENWDWRAGVNYSRVDLQTEFRNRLDFRLYLDLIQRTTPDAFNPFVSDLTQQYTQAELQDLKIDYDVSQQASLLVYDALIRGPLFEMPAGDVEAAFGAEFRVSSSEFNDSVAPEPRSTAQSFGIDRDLFALFGEVAVPLTETLMFNGSVRHEREEKNDEYDVTVLSGALSFRPVENWLLRASYSEGFVAPSTAEVAGPAGTSQPFIVDPRTSESFQLRVDFVPGTEPLEPEESEVFNIGTVFNPGWAPDMTVTLDYYTIEQTNLISSTPTLVAQSILDAYVAGGGPDNPNAPFFDDVDYNAARDEFETVRVSPRNLASRNTSGIEAAVSYLFDDTSFGDFALDVEVVRYLEFEQQLAPGLPTEDYLGTFLGLDAYPEWRGNVTLSWVSGDWRASLNEIWVGSYDNTRSPDVPVLDDYFRTDVQLTYERADWPTITMGLNNLFDEDPPSTPGLETQYVESLYDPRGIFGYVRLSVTFGQ